MRSLLQPEHSAAKLIFSVSGQGGVGKTTLLREFRRIAEESGHVVAYVDEGAVTNRVDDVPEAMHRLAEDLEGQGFRFEKFRERYKAYRVKKQEMEADPEAPKGFVGDATRGVMKIALEAGKSAVPFGSMVDSEMLASKAGELMNYGVERFRNKDEERLIKETLEVLTPLFLEGVKRIRPEKTLVLMLDTYEVTGPFLDEWVRGVLNEDYGALELSILLCVGGREPIDKNAWDEWESVIARSPLEPFTKGEAETFLASQQIKSGAVIEEIWRLSSGGLPLLVSMMAAAAPTSADAVVDPCEDAVNRFLKWETDGGKRDLAQDGACARVLNADVVAALGEGSFEWLRGCAFVLRDGGRWRYHLVVREQMLRYLGQKSPKRSAEVHRKLAAYYDGLRSGLGLETGKEAEDKTWREHSLEWIYHELCAAPQAKLELGLNGFLLALKYGSGFAQTWAEVMVQVGGEVNCGTLQKWGDRLRDGMEAFKEERYEDAIPCLTALVAETRITGPMKSVAFDWRSHCYRQSNRQELALPDALKAVKLDEKSDECQFGLALNYQNLKRYDEAITAYQRAIELNPEFATAYYNLGNTYYAQKRYEEAIETYQCAIALNPEYANAYGNLGNTYKAQKRYEEAITAYQRAIELNPEDANAYNNLGVTYKAQKRYDEAITAYQRAIELNPEYANAYNNLGITYKAQKRYDEAITAYQRAIELNPEYATAYNNLGNTYSDQKRYGEAITAYQRAIELNPEHAKAFVNRGETYRLTKRYEEALKDFDRAIELDSEHSWAIASRLEIYLFLNQPEKVIATAIAESYEGSWHFYTRALAYLKLNQPESAATDFQQAITISTSNYEKDPIDYQNTFNLALYHLAAGHHEDSDRLYTSSLTAPIEWLEMAIADLDDFLRLFPDRPSDQLLQQRLQGVILGMRGCANEAAHSATL